MCAVSFIGSFIAASLGLGGGLLVMATMASLLPPTVLIPLHGIVQLGSNVGRAFIMRSEILTHVVPAFLLGTVIGALIGGQVVVSLPTQVLQIVLGGFVLYATWGPKLRASEPGKKTFWGWIGWGVCDHVRGRDRAIGRTVRRRRIGKASKRRRHPRHADDDTARL